MPGQLNDAALRELLAGPNGVQTRDLIARARRVQNRARVLCPVDRGRLRNSIIIEPRLGGGGEPVVAIGTRVPYAIYVHEGTGIYGPSGSPIRPKTGRFLRFPARGANGGRVRGGYVFARYVRGAPGRPFLRNALPAAA